MQPLFPQQQERFSTSQTHSHHPQHQSSATHLNSDLHSSHTLNDHVLQQQQHGSPPIIIAAQPRNHLSGPNTNYSSTGKLKSTSHYGQRYNPVLATTPSSSVITASSNPPVYSQVSVSQSAELGQGITFVSQNDAQQPHLLPQTYTPNSGVQASAANPPAVGSSGVGTRQHLVPSVRSHDLLVPHWSPAPIQPYGRNYEVF
ncbi:hypothetical protein BX616_010473 [Lobosporangium transversale]|nr:hypothetical protein BX616_010473 [Lobosporangium transversale]